MAELVKRGALGAVFLVLIAVTAQAQTGKQSLAFYAAAADAADINVVTMAQDLFYNQLLALDTYIVLDHRDIVYSDTMLAAPDNQNVILFYAEITQSGGGWDCTLHAKLPGSEREAAAAKHYDSYYRILTDAKTSLTAVLQSLEMAGPGNGAGVSGVSGAAGPSWAVPTLETLAGNWQGEPYVDKIVILRGGRGFVIYKNGASMNISVKIQGDTVSVIQESKQNASFFPDLAREAALVVAQTAPPMEWAFRLDSQGRLAGTKKTVQPLSQVGGNPYYRSVEIPVTWERDL
jgi:hypothetical protein